MFVSFIRRCLFSDLCKTRVGRRHDKQMPNGKEVDIVNVNSKIMSTSIRSVDMIFIWLTIHYVYLLTI